MAKKATTYTVTHGDLTLILEPDESGGYIVTHPKDADVVTQADTVEEAFEMARDLISLLAEDRAAERKSKKTAGRRAIRKTG
jgi:antitoxin HicB